VFCVCRPCYRGQGFCGPPCKTIARTKSKRAARARHRATDEGRLDHRDHERDRRKRVREGEITSVADHGPSFLDPVAIVSPPRDPPAPMFGTVAIAGEGHDDETRTDSIADDDPEGVTRILVRMDDDVVLKAALLPCYWGPHRRAIPTQLEAMALWHQAPLRAVVSVRDVASWSRLELAEDLDGGVETAHYTVEMRAPVRERGQRIRGLGSFVDTQQLDLAGVR
jgi:hypothetical protein